MKFPESITNGVAARTAASALAVAGLFSAAGYYEFSYFPDRTDAALEQLQQAETDIVKAAAADGFKVQQPVEDPWNTAQYTGKAGDMSSVGDETLRNVDTKLNLGACVEQVVAHTILRDHEISSISSFSLREGKTTLQFDNHSQLLRTLGQNPCKVLAERK